MYYQLVRHMDYTWDEVMDEKVPQTMYTFERLREEGEERKERMQEMEDQREEVRSKT